MKASSKIEMLSRVRIVQEWLTAAHRDFDIHQNIMQKWGVSLRQANRYVALAYDDFAKMTAANIIQRRGVHIEARMALIRQCYDENGKCKDIGATRQLWDSLAKIEGLVIKQIKHSGSIAVEQPLFPDVKPEKTQG